MSDVTLLRTMTMKSKIGFGYWPELTIQDMMQLNKWRELIKMYYGLQKINFNDEVKAKLAITSDRAIPKPGKSWDMYYKNIRQMINEIHEREQTFSEQNPERWAILKEKRHSKKLVKSFQKRALSVSCVKALNQQRNRNIK